MLVSMLYKSWHDHKNAIHDSSKIGSIFSVNMHNLPEFLIKRTLSHLQFLVIICAAFRRALGTNASFFRPKIA